MDEENRSGSGSRARDELGYSSGCAECGSHFGHGPGCRQGLRDHISDPDAPPEQADTTEDNAEGSQSLFVSLRRQLAAETVKVGELEGQLTYARGWLKDVGLHQPHIDEDGPRYKWCGSCLEVMPAGVGISSMEHLANCDLAEFMGWPRIE